MYALKGTHPLSPGFQKTDTTHPKTKKYGWVPLSELGETNEYIHPLVFHRMRSVGLHKWTTKHPLTDWTCTNDGDRWWWHRKTDSDPKKRQRWLPEWAILPHKDGINYERSWYTEAVSMEQGFSSKTGLETVKTAKFTRNKPGVAEAKDGKEVDFLERLDSEVDFSKLSETSWP